MGLGLSATVSGIGLLAAMHQAGYGVVILGVTSLVIGLYRKKLVSDLPEEEIVRRIGIRINSENTDPSS